MQYTKQRSMPKYVQLYHQLRLNIYSNVYEASGQFPAECELMERFQVSRTTVRRAMALLREDGLIESRRGHGTDVLPPPCLSNFGLDDRLTSVQRVERNFIPSPVESTKNSEALVDVTPAWDEVAAALNVEPGTDVYQIRWLHFVNDMPYLFLTNFVRMDMAPSLPEQVSGMVSLYPVLAEKYGLIFSRAEEIMEPIVADFISARLLEVPTGTPLLLVCRSATCNKGPLEYSRSIIRSDLLRVKMIIQ